MATIRLKEATASEIFRRLNSYSLQNGLYAPMNAFGQIIKSMFILRYIDQVELRQAIEKQLNKVELANGFTRAVAVRIPRCLEHSDKEDLKIAEGCNRLIKNSIICWNYLYLSRLVEAARTPEERDRILKKIALHSPMAWVCATRLASTISRRAGCSTTRASCPSIPRTGSSRKAGSRQFDDAPTIAGRNGIPYGGFGAHVGLGPILSNFKFFSSGHVAV